MRRFLILLFLVIFLTGFAWGLRPKGARQASVREAVPVTAVKQTSRKELADAEDQVAKKLEPQPMMDEPQRRFLWEVEHQGNVLNEYGFKPWGQFLVAGDRDGLSRLLAEGFHGQAPSDSELAEVRTSRFQIQQWRLGSSAGVKLDAQGFIDRLLQYRQVFDDAPRVGISLMALSPSDKENLASDWRGGCQIRLWSTQSASGPREVILKVEYTVSQPEKEKLTTGGWLRSCAIQQVQIGVAPKPLFREVGAERGIRREFLTDRWEKDVTKFGHRPGGGVYVCDFNRDGRWDLFITEQGNFRMYAGQAEGRFKNVTLMTRLADLHGQRSVAPAAFADLDGDGWEDLILGNSVYRNEEGTRFTDMTAECSLRIPETATGIAVSDYDRDGHVDLYVSTTGVGPADSWLEGESGGESGNQLWRNSGNWRFADVTARARASGGRRSTFSSNWLDANNDGWSDIYVINEFGNGVMLWNQKDGTFREHVLWDHPEEYGSMGLTSGDIDNDGNIDIYIAGMYSKAGNRVIGNMWPGTYSDEITAMLKSLTGGSKLNHNLGNGEFEQIAAQMEVANVGWAYGPAMVDLDNDGWLDIHALAGFQSVTRDKPDG